MPTTTVETIHPRAGRRRRVGRAVFGALVLAGAVVLPAMTSSAATAVGLGTASSFGVLGASTVTNTGPTVVNADLGVHPGLAVTGFKAADGGPGIVNGDIHAGDATAQGAQSDALTAYGALDAQACDEVLTNPELGGRTLTPGVYCFSSSAQLTGALTLNAQGDPAATFIFRMATTLTTATDSSVLFTNSFESCNVFWQVGTSATLGTRTDFVGTLIASESISATTGATVEGRLLALNGAVTLDTNVITPTLCAAAPPPPAEEPPVDETPVDETPVDETPVDETPVDETPVDGTPVAAPVAGTPTGTEGAGGGTPAAPAVPIAGPAGPLAGGPPVIVTGGPAAPAGPTGPGVPRLADTGSNTLLAGVGLLAILLGSALVLVTDPKRATPAGRHLR